jgi:hypothetical protein
LNLNSLWSVKPQKILGIERRRAILCDHLPCGRLPSSAGLSRRDNWITNYARSCQYKNLIMRQNRYSDHVITGRNDTECSRSLKCHLTRSNETALKYLGIWLTKIEHSITVCGSLTYVLPKQNAFFTSPLGSSCRISVTVSRTFCSLSEVLSDSCCFNCLKG